MTAAGKKAVFSVLKSCDTILSQDIPPIKDPLPINFGVCDGKLYIAMTRMY